MAEVIKYGKWNKLKQKLWLGFGIIGPGIIAGTADNDAGGITTYSIVGSSFGYKMLWMLLIVGLILGITQEMGARLGLVTGKGLAALIRENFSIKATTLVVLFTFLANWANILANFAGVSTVVDIYHIPRYIGVPVVAIAMWFIVYKGSFKVVQKVFLTSSALFLAYIIAGFIAHPNWENTWIAVTNPTIELSPNFFYTAVAMIGTTITAWGQFFVQSYYVDKGVTAEHLKYSRFDIIAGSLWTIIVAFFIVIATGATLYKTNLHITDAAQAAMALEPLAGKFAKHLFAWGLLNASMLGLTVIAMTSSYLVTEAFGWEGRVDLKKESPSFYKLFTLCIFSAATFVLIPQIPLVPLIIGSQALNTFVLPILFIAALKLLNDKKIMGERKNGIIANIISVVSIAFIIIMAFTLLYLTFQGT